MSPQLKPLRRSQPSATVRLLRWGFTHLGPHLPALAGRLAYHLWFATRRFPPPAREHAWQSNARLGQLKHAASQLATYQWGDEQRPRVLLIHGWNARALQLGAFVEPLLAAGFQVLGFDAPAHGRSPGNSTNIFEISHAIQALERAQGPFAGAIAHSFGVPAVARALLDGMTLPRLVAIAAPADGHFLLQRFAAQLQVPEAVIERMRKRMTARFGLDIFTRLATVDMFAQLQLPGLILHDRQDRDIPWQHAERLQRAWPQASLHLTQGLGHTRILRDPQVVEQAVQFLHLRRNT